MPDYRYRVTIVMTPEDEARYRAAHRLQPDEDTRERLAETVHTETLGTGLDEGWWTQVRVR